MMKLSLAISALLLVLHGADSRYMGALLCEHGKMYVTKNNNDGLDPCASPGTGTVEVRDRVFDHQYSGWDYFGHRETGEIYVSSATAQAALCYWDGAWGEWSAAKTCPQGHEAVYMITHDSQVGRRLGQKEDEIEPVLEEKEEDEAPYLEVEIDGEKWIVFTTHEPED